MSFDLKILKGDIATSSGGPQTVTGTDKVRQDILKILLTELGSNKFHPAYGSKLGAIQIGYIADPELVDSDLRSSAEEAILKLMNLQGSQSKVQFVSPEERILAINYIDVTRDKLDPRMYNIGISVTTQRLKTIEDTVAVRVI